ncbi:MAG: sialidase family protein [Draconibacterium sp.]
MTFQRQNNHNGPSHFYFSNDRGNKWNGPYIFPNLNTDGVATRTDYLINGKKELSAFLTVAKSNKKEGRVVFSRTADGGITWEIVSWIGSEPDGFNIMPSSLQLSPSELITVIRTRTGNGQDLLTSYVSEDNGKTWIKLKDPVADTGKGGSPPALVKLNDGRLALGYIYRSKYGSRVNVRFSSDNGRNWSDEIVLSCGDGATGDVGYPRMVQRPDGKLVIIYYWNNASQEGAKPYHYIAYTIFDPNQWE